jgi:tetraacyldisaccharide 4'-kinase
LFCEDKQLPAGRLREPQRNKKRAQMVVVTKCPFPMEPTACQAISEKLALLPGQDLFFTSCKYKSLLPVFGESNPVKKESIDRLKKEAYSAVLLAGLANPSGLIRYLSAYITGLQPLIYPDHHAFSRKDIRNLSETFGQIKNAKKIIITSEKDAVRLLDCPHIPETIKSVLFYLPIEVVFNQDKEELFIQTIENHVTTFERNRILA